MNKKSLFLLSLLLLIIPFKINAETNLPGFNVSPYYDEQLITFYFAPDIRVQINAPSPNKFNPNLPMGLALFALPNGNTIEQTVGKILDPGDDWHYDIQHIGAQTRFLRERITEYNLVTVYLEATQKSWPAWNSQYPSHAEILKNLVEYLKSLFKEYDPFVVLTGHSGGGRFTFSFIDAFSEIPGYVKRISFLDSNYGYEDTYGSKVVTWLNSSEENILSVIAYNDSVALYNGEPIVSATGGTWYRSKLMKKYLENYYTFTDEEDDEFIRYTALNGRIKFILKKNPNRAILHTVQVERNGFIQGMVSGTAHEGVDYAYYGARAYSQWIQINVDYPQPLMIPPRSPDFKSGSEFMQSVMNMSFADRETEIYNEVSKGNIPNFLRSLTTVEASFNDGNGTSHTVKYEVMPDYLAVGSDSDFCRIPTGPITAQKLADLFGAVMPTRKLVDNIYLNSEIKLEPVTYTPVGNQNELVSKFIEHNDAINQQFNNASGIPGQLTGGTKKDVVLSNLIIDPNRPNHVVIYGWHQLNGQPIQPLTNIHINSYTDYSHGIRFLNSEILIDNEIKKVQEILQDPVLYKILSDESGQMVQPTYISSTTFAPQKPKSFGVKNESINKVRVIIKNDSTIQNYKVFLSKNGKDFPASFTSNTNDFVISGLTPDSIVYLKLVANNSFGESPESEVLAAVPGNNKPKVLIVNGFDRGSAGNTYDFIRQHGNAFVNNSAPFESTTNDAIIDGVFKLNDYEIADYILGDESTSALDPLSAQRSGSDAPQMAGYPRQTHHRSAAGTLASPFEEHSPPAAS
ncbi:MAG: fibronectin type III domain-containing protein, partial [Ignavibacteriaceae bacterium]